MDVRVWERRSLIPFTTTSVRERWRLLGLTMFQARSSYARIRCLCEQNALSVRGFYSMTQNDGFHPNITVL